MKLDDVRGFVFDVDGSLVHRGADFRSEPLPGAVEVIEAIRASGRPLVLFTNGSHLDPETFAAGLWMVIALVLAVISLFGADRPLT